MSRQPPRAGLPARACPAPGRLVAEQPVHLIGLDVEVGENLVRHTLPLAHEPEQDVFGSDVVVPELHRFAQRQLQNLLGARGEWRLREVAVLSMTDDRFELLPRPAQGNVQPTQRVGRDPPVLAQEAEQEMLGSDVGVAEASSLLLGENHDLAGPFGESLEHAVYPPLRAGRSLTPSGSSIGTNHAGPPRRRRAPPGWV